MTLAIALMFRNVWARVMCKAGSQVTVRASRAYMPDVTRAGAPEMILEEDAMGQRRGYRTHRR
jgi:hypothetical protein